MPLENSSKNNFCKFYDSSTRSSNGFWETLNEGVGAIFDTLIKYMADTLEVVGISGDAIEDIDFKLLFQYMIKLFFNKYKSKQSISIFWQGIIYANSF